MAAIGAVRRDRVGHVGTHRVQGVDLAAGVVTHLTVAFFCPLPQFADIPEHQNGASGKAGEYINGSAHRGGICVVAVVDHTHAVGSDLGNGAAFDWLDCLQPGCNAFQAHAQGMGSGGGGQRVADVVGAQQVQLHLHRALRPVQGEGRAATGVAPDVAGVEISLRIVQCKAEDAVLAGALAPDLEGFVGQIKDSRAALAQALEDLALGLDDLLGTAEFANVGGPGVVDDDDLRLGQTDGIADLADTRGAQLDHRCAVLREISSKVSGAPRSLLRLPRVASTKPRVRRMLASSSLTVVLPLEPVMAATGLSKAARFRAPSWPRASRLSATTSCGKSTPSTSRSTSAATAPLALTSAK